jgi:hypothetical protein
MTMERDSGRVVYKGSAEDGFVIDSVSERYEIGVLRPGVFLWGLRVADF